MYCLRKDLRDRISQFFSISEKPVLDLLKRMFIREGGQNNCYVLSIAVSFNRTAVTIIRSSLLGIEKN